MGLDFDFSKYEKELNRKIDSLSGEVDLPKLLTDKFISENTKFQNMDDFFSACNIHNAEDLTDIPESDLDKLVADNSNFASWDEMLGSAITDYFADNWDDA